MAEQAGFEPAQDYASPSSFRDCPLIARLGYCSIFLILNIANIPYHAIGLKVLR